MKMKPVQEYESFYTLRKSKIRRQRKRRRLSLQIFLMLIIFTAIAAYFCNRSFLRFLIIFAAELVGISLVTLLFVYITVSINKDKKDSNRKILFDERIHPVKKVPDRRLVKLDKRNFNWSDEDIQRNQQSDSIFTRKENEVFSYRSPFEPINPPARKDESGMDETDMKDEMEKASTQSPTKYKIKVIRKKKKQDKSSYSPQKTPEQIYTKKKKQDKNI